MFLLITYLENLSFPPVDSPKITEHPKCQSVSAGAEATFKIEAIGDHLTFQWWKNECNLHDNSNYNGTNTNTLMIQHVRMSNEGDYKCLVKNMVNEEQEFSEEAKLTVCEC